MPKWTLRTEQTANSATAANRQTDEARRPKPRKGSLTNSTED